MVSKGASKLLLLPPAKAPASSIDRLSPHHVGPFRYLLTHSHDGTLNLAFTNVSTSSDLVFSHLSH